MGDKQSTSWEHNVIRQRQTLSADWTLCACVTDRYQQPKDIETSADWLPTSVPGTVAAALAHSGNLSTDDYDNCDWWYRCRFSCDSTQTDSQWYIFFEGLATYTDIWLNGQHILTTGNMFRAFRVEISKYIHIHNDNDNQLYIVFRSLTKQLAEKRPRPRWKTNLVEHQQLRWHRTTLLGRIPGWTPPIKPVGPWKNIFLEKHSHLSVEKLTVRPYATSSKSTFIALYCELSLFESSIYASDKGIAPELSVQLKLGNTYYPLNFHQQDNRLTINHKIAVDAPLWWPHTHGTPALLDCTLEILINGETNTLHTAKLGFKHIEVLRQPITDSQTTLMFVINGEQIFCRGACWSVSDIHTLSSDIEVVKRSLTLARDAGVNMLRIGGTMLYEQQAFYQLCDQLGIMVWQDFMFANMDYPTENPAFLENVTQEVTEQLQRLNTFSCLSAYCGNSEVQQQAAMFGMPAEHWQNPLFDQHIPSLCETLHPSIPYFPSTPCEGAMPFHVNQGLSHFYGVGAYQRSLSDRIIDQVKFSPECLGFSNIPTDNVINTLMQGNTFAPHHPTWKAGIPRDTGTGWDFEDIRDYYVKMLFNVDPAALRYSDPDRYLQLSRSVTGEVMTQVFSRWRSSASCGGGLVWFFKDIVPGAGWGLLDTQNSPKAVYYYLRRVWASKTVLLTDNGLDGLGITVINNTACAFKGVLELGLIDSAQNVIALEKSPVQVDKHDQISLHGDDLLQHFYDTTYHYRFGPPKHDLAFSKLTSDKGKTIAETFHFPNGLNLPIHTTANVTILVESIDQGLVLTITTDRFLQCVHLDIRDHEANDNFFHLLPDTEKKIEMRCRIDSERSFRGNLRALNLLHPIRIQP